MSYNHGKEERKWPRWKLAEEKMLRACGMDESTIEQLRLWDRAMFNSDRRFYEKLQDTGTYLDSVAESEAPTEIYTVEDLLNDIENAELLKTLLKMNGYSTNEIAILVYLSRDTIYKRIAVLKRKLKKFQMSAAALNTVSNALTGSGDLLSIEVNTLGVNEIPATKKYPIANVLNTAIADDGAITYFPVRYENGMVIFTTIHFSAFGIVESYAAAFSDTNMARLVRMMILHGNSLRSYFGDMRGSSSHPTCS